MEGLRRKAWTVVLFVLLGRISVAQTEKVWIDTDMSMGILGKDVDDGLALMMALRSEKLSIEGVSLVYGNTSRMNYSYRVTRRLLRWYAKESIPVYRGADSRRMLGKATPAVTALAEALKKEKLTIVALGPATNVATLLMLYPELVTQINQVILCAGRTPGLRFRPGNGNVKVCDCNFEKDVRAFEVILSADVKVVLSGYEPASYIHLSKEDIQPLKESSSPSDQWVYRQLRKWQLLWRTGLGSKQGFIPFDAVTMSYLLAPECLQCYRNVPVEVKLPRNKAWFSLRSHQPYLWASYELEASAKADYCYRALPALKPIILKSLTE